MRRSSARAASPDETARRPRRARALVVAVNRCHGCQACMVACSLVHEGQAIPSRARIQVRIDPFTGNHTIRYCHQCKRAPCARACPRDAITRADPGDPWRVDAERCDGCGECVAACPFEAIRLAPDGRGVLRCDTCDGDPACVAACPDEALTWGRRGR
jgi:anaerobic carbon-monoxide dehydrogenase iron sulfur subunit